MASLFSAKNETILALGNANIDLSIFKFELKKEDVRKEYQGLGQALSIHRLASAENGQQHRTARRLGALFEEVIPDIDVLAGVYGQRASEIAVAHGRESNSVGSDFNPNFHFGPFASHAGIDGTSIYAAASSGDGVIALHLLACMLAKMFTSAEATAIWCQLVADRIGQLNAKSSNSQISGVTAKFAAAVGEDIKRNDLAAWDASARAWLEVANTVKRRQERQFMLIHANLPNIHASSNTYHDILENWRLAMITLQNAIQGVPQDISNGAVLLGITAWHIYPNIIVFYPEKHIQLNDDLVPPSGSISLGLVRSDSDEHGDINWSVSLSHLRYYGDPVAIERSLGVDTDRITLQDFQYIAMGCVFSSWANTASIDVVDASGCLVALGDCLGLSGEVGASQQSGLGWLVPLIIAAQNLLISRGDDRDSALYFVEFGRRRGRRLLDESFQDIVPVFGLLNPYQMFRVSRDFEKADQEVESQIAVYRQLALSCGFGHDECIIVSLPTVVSRATHRNEDTVLEGRWEIASAMPILRPTNKRSQDGTLRSTERYTRWVHLDRTRDAALQHLAGHVQSHSYSNYLWNGDDWEWDKEMRSAITFNQPGCQCLQKDRQCDDRCTCRRQGKRCTSLCQCLKGFTGIQESLSCSNVRECRMEYDAPDEDCYWLSLRATMEIDHTESLHHQQFKWKDPPVAFHSAYVHRDPSSEFADFADPVAEDEWTFVEGDYDVNKIKNEKKPGPNPLAGASADDFRINYLGDEVRYRPVHTYGRAALYLTDRSDIDMPLVTLSQLKNALSDGRISPTLLRNHLTHVGRHGVDDFTKSLKGVNHTGRTFFRSLDAIAAITELYQNWSDATIKISITKSPIGASRWAQNITREDIDLSERLAGPENYLTKIAVSKAHRANKFACIVMLESGGIDLHPDDLDLVMGVANGNSIYAAEYLLSDPNVEDLSGKSSFAGIRRIVGSLSEPGIVCLIPPKATKRVQLDSTQHRLVRHDTFDGEFVDRFDQSSLHLTLTKWRQKIGVARGSINADVLMREALVKVFNGPRWIADLDILKGLEEATTLRMSPCECSDAVPSALGGQLVDLFGDRLKSISTWDELLLCQDNLLPEEVGAVRASGNWYARLAAVALASSIGCPLTILPCGGMCLNCSQKLSSWQPTRPKTGRAPLNLFIM